MSFVSINPYTGEELARFDAWQPNQIEAALQTAATAQQDWSALPIHQRVTYVQRLAVKLRDQIETLATLATLEMGKRIIEARAEIEKCALLCNYYAEHAERFLADEPVDSDAYRSLVSYQPLGTVLAIMPWNFPFWQVFRCAVPALIAGNTVLLKHASNVPQCALAIERLFKEAGFAEGVFQTLLIRADQVSEVIRDPRVHAVSLTGSESAGRKVASIAGESLKPVVLELGGSDAFIVLEDAPLEQTVRQAVRSRFQNSGQSCIAAKRFIVVEAIADRFITAFANAVADLEPGDPLNESCRLGPMARADLRDEIHEQVQDAIDKGATVVTGGQPVEGSHAAYAATILDGIQPGMRPWDEELFGPVASIIRVRDEHEALAVANASRFGLGGSVWTADLPRGERIARRIEAGSVFVNGMVKSDPRLPFGGIKASGFGRELAAPGIRAFCNIKTLWMGQSENLRKPD